MSSRQVAGRGLRARRSRQGSNTKPEVGADLHPEAVTASPQSSWWYPSPPVGATPFAYDHAIPGGRVHDYHATPPAAPPSLAAAPLLLSRPNPWARTPTPPRLAPP